MEPLNARISISPDVISQQVQLGETLLLNVKTLVYFALDDTGSRFWQVMQSTPDADEVVHQVAQHSELDVVDLQTRYRAILVGMQRSGLIEVHRNS